ncbi:MAG: PH domain-containing protein [Candidatus Saccharimonadales bacterium]
MNPDQTPPAPTDPVDPEQPVAYDAQGRPLYAHPPVQAAADPQTVHMSRAVDPVMPEISASLKAKHDESVKLYPFLNLSESEYVISAVRRHPIGLLIPVAVVIFLVVVIIAVLISYPMIINSVGGPTALPSYDIVMLIGLLVLALLCIGGYIAVWVYRNNKFFLTNESVIQEIQLTLFSHNEQTVSLENIEDASYKQLGIIQTMFDYGSIRLSTQGDETTYRFSYVSSPKNQIALLNNAVEAFKNGRPIER